MNRIKLTKLKMSTINYLLPDNLSIVLKVTTKNVIEYFPAFTKCGNASRESLYRRRHWANRIHAGIHPTTHLV